MKTLKEKFALGWAAVLLIAIITCVILFFVSGCVSAEKAQMVLEKKQVLAKVCAEKYPVKTEYIKGDSVVITTIDTIYSGNDIIFDTVYSVAKDTVIITKTIPITKVIKNTIRITDTIVKENTAAVEATKIDLNKCKSANEALTAKLNKVKRVRSTYFWLLIVVTILLFRKPILKMLNIFL